jgi:hypothetical protein
MNDVIREGPFLAVKGERMISLWRELQAVTDH